MDKHVHRGALLLKILNWYPQVKSAKTVIVIVIVIVVVIVPYCTVCPESSDPPEKVAPPPLSKTLSCYHFNGFSVFPYF